MRISDWSSDVCSSDLAFANRHGGELDPVGDVAHRIDGGTGGLAVLVDLHRAIGVQLNARRFKTEPVRIGDAARDEHQYVAIQRIAAPETEYKRPIRCFLDPPTWQHRTRGDKVKN